MDLTAQLKQYAQQLLKHPLQKNHRCFRSNRSYRISIRSTSIRRNWTTSCWCYWSRHCVSRSYTWSRNYPAAETPAQPEVKKKLQRQSNQQQHQSASEAPATSEAPAEQPAATSEAVSEAPAAFRSASRTTSGRTSSNIRSGIRSTSSFRGTSSTTRINEYTSNGSTPSTTSWSFRQDVAAQFGLTDIGGYREGDPQDHGKGLAVDVMVPVGSVVGNQVAQYAVDNISNAGISYVIYRQQFYAPVDISTDQLTHGTKCQTVVALLKTTMTTFTCHLMNKSE